MNRRGFLSSLIGAVATAVAEPDLEKLIWEPGKKTIFIPPAPKVGNQFVTTEMLAMDSLKLLQEQMQFARTRITVDDHIIDAFRYQNIKIGDTIIVRKPPMYIHNHISGTEVRQMQRRFDMALNAHLDAMAQAGHDLIHTRGEVWDQLTLTSSPRSAKP